MVNSNNTADIIILIATMMVLIEISVITFLMSESVNIEKYFKNLTESDKEDSICNI